MPIGQRCWHFTFTPDDSKVLLACGRSNNVVVIDATTYMQIRTIEGFKFPWGVVTYPKSYGSLDLPKPKCPLVKPTTTGRRINLTAVPRPVAPMIRSSTPAIRLHMNNPSMPYFATMPNATTTNAPVGHRSRLKTHLMRKL
jgi:YVTN family beta-propeller protein